MSIKRTGTDKPLSQSLDFLRSIVRLLRVLDLFLGQDGHFSLRGSQIQAQLILEK
jgi:hypothetical protein